MPEQAEMVFNRCISVKSRDLQNKSKQEYQLQDAPRKTFEEENLTVMFNFNFMDDDYLIDSWKSTEEEDPKSDTVSKVNCF